MQLGYEGTLLYTRSKRRVLGLTVFPLCRTSPTFGFPLIFVCLTFQARTFVVTVEPHGDNARPCTVRRICALIVVENVHSDYRTSVTKVCSFLCGQDAGTVVVLKCKLHDCESETPFLPLYNWKSVGENLRLNSAAKLLIPTGLYASMVAIGGMIGP